MSKARNLADLISGNSKIEAIEIADGVLTAAKMAADSIDSAQYVDGSIDTAHLSNNISINTSGALVSDGLTVNTNTVYVDSTNNRVGIGTTSPDSNTHLHITSGSGTKIKVVEGIATIRPSVTR